MEAKKALETKEANCLDIRQKSAQVAETLQQQQLKSYVAARRDLNSGKISVAACNAQRAYNYGRLEPTEPKFIRITECWWRAVQPMYWVIANC